MFRGLPNNQADVLLILFGGEVIRRRPTEPDCGFTQFGRIHPATMRALVRKGFLQPSLLNDCWIPTKKAWSWLR